jgi:hypothetical protein
LSFVLECNKSLSEMLKFQCKLGKTENSESV